MGPLLKHLLSLRDWEELTFKWDVASQCLIVKRKSGLATLERRVSARLLAHSVDADAELTDQLELMERQMKRPPIKEAADEPVDAEPCRS